jgi:hypothetical protein
MPSSGSGYFPVWATSASIFRHMSYDLSPTILTRKWFRQENSRSLRMALFCRNM